VEAAPAVKQDALVKEEGEIRAPDAIELVEVAGDQDNDEDWDDDE
jgi:hypothetical protein